MLPTDSDRTKSKSYGDICSKNHHNISDRVGIQELLLDDSKDLINNRDIGRVDNEVTWIEEMPPTNPNRTKSKSYSDNLNSNCDSNRIGGKEQGSDNLEGPK